MKSLIFSLLLICPFLVLAQKAEKIVSISQETYPMDYYHTQSKLWKKKIDQKSNDAVAWENYYAACRMANLRTKKKAKPYQLDEIIKQAAKAIPNTFEYHRIAYWNGAMKAENYHHLEKAYQLDPKRTEMYDSMVSMYESERNLSKKKFFNQKLYETAAFSPGAMNWNYNQLISVEDNAILLTYGDFDTYPSWMLQQVKQVKPDVLVLNLSMLRTEAYRKKIFKELNLPSLKTYKGDVGFTEMTEFALALVPHLAREHHRPVYLGVGCGKAILDRFDTDLYIVGLAFKYSPKAFDNIEILQANIENDFVLDYLKMTLYKDKSENLLKRLNLNYLPALVMLYKHYKATKSPKIGALKKLIYRIAAAGDMEDKIEQLFH